MTTGLLDIARPAPIRAPEDQDAANPPVATDGTADRSSTNTEPVIAWHEPATSDRAGQAAAGAHPTPLRRRHLRDAALTLLTLGLYRCWIRTRLRQRLWASVEFGGEPLRYTGTARELLLPALAILGTVIAVVLALVIAKWLAIPRPRLFTPSPWRLVVTIPLIYVMGLTAWLGRAYLLDRTRLGPLGSNLVGDRHAYARTHFLTMLAMVPTLGWLMPFRQVLLHRRMVEAIHIGPHRFRVEGTARPLLGRFAIAWIGVIGVYLSTVVTLGLSSIGAKIVAAKATGSLPQLDAHEAWLAAAIGATAAAAIGLTCAWYRIGAWRKLAAMTRLDGRALRLEAPTGAYMRLVLSNTLIRVGSLFLAGYIADERHARFLLSRLSTD